MKPRKLGLNPAFTDDKLVQLLLNNPDGLSDRELDEVSVLASGFAAGTVDRLARTTRDYLVAIARRCKLLLEGGGKRRGGLCKQKSECVATPGEVTAALILSPESLAKALAFRPNLRKGAA